MNIPTEPYLQQQKRWPVEGRHILANYNDASVIVYQAYRPDIGHFAARHGYFGGEFSFNRMSWFKPNFLWMMYRSGWGMKEHQEITLAVRVRREFFESVLEQAVHSTFDAASYANELEWKRAVASSDVRLQWDPDHSPSGSSVQRRAIQLGLRGQALREYGRDAIMEIEDISEFVATQRPHALSGNYENLLTPVEYVYMPDKPEVMAKLGLAMNGGHQHSPNRQVSST